MDVEQRGSHALQGHGYDVGVITCDDLGVLVCRDERSKEVEYEKPCAHVVGGLKPPVVGVEIEAKL